MADSFTVARSETIAASPTDVFAKVGNLAGWDEWSPWAEMDPDMDKSYSGTAGEVGSHYAWSGNRKVGQGEMTITAVEPNESITIDLKFLKPFKSENVTNMTVAPSGDGSQVTWSMTGPMTFMTKLMAKFGKTMDKMVGPDFEKGLSKLKRITEAG